MRRACSFIGVAILSTLVACFAELDSEGGETSGDPGDTSMSGSDTSSGASSTTTSTSSSTTSSDSDTGQDTSSTSLDPDDTGESSTGEASCGNGVVDPGEGCDHDVSGCTDCQLDDHACNPLNNAGCPNHLKCSFDDTTLVFGCLPYIKRPPGELGEGNCHPDGAFRDNWCDVGLACLPGGWLADCDSNCCAAFCDTHVADSCPQGETCWPWFDAGQGGGLQWLGACRT